MNPDDLKSLIQTIEHLAKLLEDSQYKSGWDVASVTGVANFVVLALTLFAIIWYARETVRLRKAAQAQIVETQRMIEVAQAQNEAAVQPILVPSHTLEELKQKMITNSGCKEYLNLRNIGNGPAFNIEVEANFKNHPDPGITLKLEGNLIHKSESIGFAFLRSNDNRFVTRDELLSNHPLHPKMTTVKIKCTSVSGKEYMYRFAVDFAYPYLIFKNVHLRGGHVEVGAVSHVERFSAKLKSFCVTEAEAPR